MNLPSRVHIALHPVDFRKSIDGLVGVVRSALVENPLDGRLFVFHNEQKTSLKLLWWDHGGFCLLYKRLARGRFRIPKVPGGVLHSQITPAELAALLEGIDLSGAQRLPRWNPKKVNPDG